MKRKCLNDGRINEAEGLLQSMNEILDAFHSSNSMSTEESNEIYCAHCNTASLTKSNNPHQSLPAMNVFQKLLAYVMQKIYIRCLILKFQKIKIHLV